MAIDMFTGEHICIGLAIGEGCDACKKKHPHLLATTPEQIAEGRRLLQRAITAFENDQNGEKPATTAELNSYLYGGPKTQITSVVSEPAPEVLSDGPRPSLARCILSLAVPTTILGPLATWLMIHNYPLLGILTVLGNSTLSLCLAMGITLRSLARRFS